MRLYTFLIAVCLLALSGCASTPISPILRPTADNRAELVVFRESAFSAGGVALTVGVGNKGFANIGNSERVRVQLPAGEHDVFVQARSADPTRLRVSLKRDSLVCLRTSSSPGTYAKAAVPIVLIITGYHFYLDEVPCPASDELGKYKDVGVEYQ
jgi:hypothetical protein